MRGRKQPLNEAANVSPSFSTSYTIYNYHKRNSFAQKIYDIKANNGYCKITASRI